MPAYQMPIERIAHAQRRFEIHLIPLAPLLRGGAHQRLGRQARGESVRILRRHREADAADRDGGAQRGRKARRPHTQLGAHALRRVRDGADGGD